MILKDLIKQVARPAAKAAMHFPPFKGNTILEMDGGISSQMKFYIVGRRFEELERVVSFGMRWYHECGKDMDGRFERNYVLRQMFPEIRMAETPWNIQRLIRFASFYDNGIWEHTIEECDKMLPQTVYLDGYYEPSAADFRRLFHENFVRDKAVANDSDYLRLEESIRKSPYPVTIHVRRGDLSRAVEGYGDPVTVKYFIDAAKHVLEQHPDADFTIFSDEPDWCVGNILPYFPTKRVAIADSFDSSQGYFDMLALSWGRTIIASKGSFGKYAAMLSPDKPELILADDATEKIWRDIYTHAPLRFF